jgi:hypothetical protein
LRRLQREARQLPVPPDVGQARTRFLGNLDAWACAEAVSTPTPTRRRALWLRPLLAGLATASVLAAVALVWSFTRREPAADNLSRPEPVLAARPGPTDRLLTRTLESTLRLVEPDSADEQVGVLAGLAADLRRTAIEVARQRPAGDLPLLAGLYQDVVRRGLAARARDLPAARAASVVRQLEEDERAISGAAGQMLPLLADHLRGMAEAARAARRDIRAGAPVGGGAVVRANPPPTPASGNDTMLLMTVVWHGLRLSEERDPVRRADCCADLADCLVKAIVWNSAAGATERAARLGSYLRPILERGVNGNLERVPVQKLDPARKAELERVWGHAGSATALLRKNLERAAPPVRQKLRRLLEFAQRWQAHGQPSSDRPGKPEGSK